MDNIYLPPVIVSPSPDCILGAPFLEDVLLLAEDGAPLPAEDVLEQGLPEELQEAGHVPAGIHLLQTLSSIMTADCLCFYIRWSIELASIKAVVNCAVKHSCRTFHLETENVRVLEVDHLGHPLEVALHVGVHPAVDVVRGDPQSHYHVLFPEVFNNLSRPLPSSKNKTT